MRRLFFLFLGGLAVFSVWFFYTRMAFPTESAREAVGETHLAGYRLNGEDPYFRVAFRHLGQGPRVFMFPSLGREASDFNELILQVSANGYRTVAPDPPGINGSDPMHDADLRDMAYIQVTGSLWLDKKSSYTEDIVYVGHAFGNRVARMAAYQNPENVKAVILLAAGGQVPMEPNAEQALRDIFNPMKSHKARMEDVEYAFFAEGNEIPDHWTRGWHTKTAIAQGKAVAVPAGDDSWHCAGGVPMLIIQPMQDRIAPIENAYALRDKCPQEVEIVEIENAGHALLPEQPEAVAEAVLAFLAKHHPVE